MLAVQRRGEPTRRKILDAAESVIAERGVDAATFTEINERAGQRNNSATQYHFGDRTALLEAVVERHSIPLARRRDVLLAELSEKASLIDLVDVVVRPLVEQLSTDSGRRYLSIQAALLSHPDRSTWPAALARPWERPGLDAMAERVVAAGVPLDLADPIMELRSEMAVQLLFHTLADRARNPERPPDHETFAQALTAAVAALIQADLT